MKLLGQDIEYAVGAYVGQALRVELPTPAHQFDGAVGLVMRYGIGNRPVIHP